MLPNLAQTRHGLPDHIAIHRLDARTTNTDWWTATCSRHGGAPIDVCDRRADEWEVAELARTHNSQFHRDPAPDQLTDAEISRAQALSLSKAQEQILSWIEEGKVTEYADGFSAFDISPDRADVSRKITRDKITRLWAARWIDATTDTGTSRDLQLTSKGRDLYRLWRRALRQEEVQPASRDQRFGLRPADLAAYPLLSEQRWFDGEPRMVAVTCACGAGTRAPVNEPPPPCTHHGTHVGTGLVINGSLIQPDQYGRCSGCGFDYTALFNAPGPAGAAAMCATCTTTRTKPAPRPAHSRAPADQATAPTPGAAGPHRATQHHPTSTPIKESTMRSEPVFDGEHIDDIDQDPMTLDFIDSDTLLGHIKAAVTKQAGQTDDTPGGDDQEDGAASGNEPSTPSAGTHEDQDTEAEAQAEAVPQPWVFIVPCSASKQPTPDGQPIAARDLYTGSYHRAAMRAVEAVTATGDTVLVCSAKHGLVTTDTPLLDYDVKAGDPGTITRATMAEQAQQLIPAGAQVVVLGGKAFVQLVRLVAPGALAVTAGTTGIGDQLARYADIVESGDIEQYLTGQDADGIHATPAAA
ncbi:DUF6884 domain-containing protein [Streptomyces hydrogenans]|uniref:DUF6884 domain-containing protein n=1 Tax=Streptomyces hydrogenans TaxID=1873719 RepID=UPI003801CDB7